jgi:hypothetical protein
MIYAQVPNLNQAGDNPPSKCFTKNTGVSPNGDVQLDSFIPLLLHELVETVIQPMPWQGRSWYDDNTQVVAV